MIKQLSLLLVILLYSSCTKQVVPSVIIVGDHIITMDDNKPEAVALLDDKIMAAGTKSDILKLQGSDTRIIKLGNRALIPGFIDAYGHFSYVANRQEILNLSPPPISSITKIDDIITLIKNKIDEENIPDGELIYGVGYDDSFLEERRHPTKKDLDRASITHPIIIKHISGHVIAVNSLALQNSQINKNTKPPVGGIIRRRSDTNEPNGVIEETAMRLFPGESSGLSFKKKKQLRRKAFDIYASYGITTIQDCNVKLDFVKDIYKEVEENPFPIDVVSYVYGNNIPDNQIDSVTFSKLYKNGFRNAGIKFGLDGSPQGRTAWLSKPYTARPEGSNVGYVAYNTYNPKLYKERTKKIIDKGGQVLVHANGDQAIELMIDGIEEAISKHKTIDHRSVIIHAQLIRKDQLDRSRKLGVIPSYFSAHSFFWGDWHRLSFGEERASFISPVRATINRSIPFTIHNDSPVVPPDMMRLINITVNRKTRSGFILGPDQRATVLEALYACTLGASYQYFEEDTKGSITPGKFADLVILSENPLLSNTTKLDEIQILETFSKGKSIFKK